MGDTPSEHELSRRERQIMDAVYKHGAATAAQIRQTIPDPPTYAAVRRLIAILEEKGFLRHEVDGQRYVYYPIVGRRRASRTALRHLTDTFFSSSPVRAFEALLDVSAARLDAEDLRQLRDMIDKARKEGD